MTTPKRCEAVAWRRRYVCPQEGPSIWLPCEERDVPTLRAAGCYEVEPLYSQEQMDALQGEVSRLRAELSDAESDIDTLASHNIALQEALRFAERHCPCGARPESPDTHPHMPGCLIAKALTQPEPGK